MGFTVFLSLSVRDAWPDPGNWGTSATQTHDRRRFCSEEEEDEEEEEEGEKEEVEDEDNHKIVGGRKRNGN